MEQSDYVKYYISGERINRQNDYCGCKCICLCEYDSLLGRAQQGYHPLSMDDMLKMLYAIYSGKEGDLTIISNKCFESIPKLKKLGILTEDAEGKTVIDVPVISWKDRFSFYELSEKYDAMIRESFGEEIKGLMKGAVKLPGHLKSVPDWQRYMECCSKSSMLVVENAYKNGFVSGGIRFAGESCTGNVFSVGINSKNHLYKVIFYCPKYNSLYLLGDKPVFF